MPIALAHARAIGPAKGNDRKIVSALSQCRQFPAHGAWKQAHIGCDQNRKNSAEKKAKKETLSKKLRKALNESADAPENGIADDDEEEGPASPEPVSNLAQNDSPHERPETLRRVRRPGLSEGQT